MNCPFCTSINTKANGRAKSGAQRYLCKACGRSFSDSDRQRGRPKRTDGLTKEQAWYQRNKKRAAQAQRDRRAKKKDRETS